MLAGAIGHSVLSLHINQKTEKAKASAGVQSFSPGIIEHDEPNQNLSADQLCGTLTAAQDDFLML